MIGSTLVLNANYEPINVCDARRAINLIMAQKAALIVNGRGVLKTVSTAFPIPSVIRLHMIVRHPRLHLKLTRREIFRRDNYICQYCGRHTLELTVDHVIPRHLGGKHIWHNVVAACPHCNHRKGGRIIEEVNMHLLRVPKEPPNTAAYIFGRHLDEYAEWEPFITGW
jgi:5-methylcytosine-specific restriction endonuclease McrA